MGLGFSSYGILRVLWPLAVTSSNQDLVVSEDSAARTDTFSIPAGDYYQHNDASMVAGGRAGLLAELVSQLNASATLAGTYAVAAATPAGSSLSHSGIALTATGITDFTLEFSAAGTTINPRWLGFGSSPGDQQSTGLALASPYSLLGAWQTPHAASDERDQPEHTVLSSGKGWEAAHNEWDGVGLPRQIFVRALYAAHILRGRGGHAGHAADAGLPVGDINNAFEDLWWAAVGEELLVIYEEGDQDLQVDTHPYELCKLKPKDKLFGHLKPVERGERYDLRFDLLVDPTASAYDDP